MTLLPMTFATPKTTGVLWPGLLALRLVVTAMGAVVAAMLAAGCAQPGASGSPAAATGPATPLPALTQVTRFGPERVAQLRQMHEGRGWALLSGSVRRVDPPGSGVEFLTFVDPRSVARTGNLVRVRSLGVYARPIGTMVSSIAFQQVDCQARTLQTMAADLFSDEPATVRLSSTNQAAAAMPVQAQSLGETLLNSVCAGRFAAGAPRSAPPAGTPRASSGSGVAVGAQRVLTNAHVTANCKTIEVTAAGQKYPASVRKRDAVTDLALLEVAGLPALPAPALRRQAQVGEAVMAAGYPLSGLLGSDLVVTDGIVNALSGLGNSASHLQMSAAIQPGNSGGPLLDRGGHLVGLVVSKLNAVATMAMTGDIPQNVNFAIKPELLALFLQSENLPLGPVEQGHSLDTQQLASRARTFTVKVDCRP
jgi:S1-C subfamily serine protease